MEEGEGEREGCYNNPRLPELSCWLAENRPSSECLNCNSDLVVLLIVTFVPVIILF